MLKLAVLSAAALAASLFQIPSLVYSTPSTSMSPTLTPGDYILFPFLFGGELRRGDVAIFDVATQGQARTAYVKRIVGLPGDRVQYVGGALKVNGEPAPRTPIAMPPSVPSTYASAKAFRERLGSASYDVIEMQDNGYLDNTPVFEAPSGAYFMLGDNRDNSSDSRLPSVIGYVRAEAIVGRVCWVFRFPFSVRNICKAVEPVQGANAVSG